MAHVVNNPADTQTIAAGPADIRAEIAKVANDQVTNAGLLNGLASGNAAGQIPVNNGVKNVGLNAELHGGNLPSAYAAAGHGHSVATGSSDGFMVSTDKTKLDGVQAGAEVNQNAFSNILVGGTTIQADSKTDTFELVPGANIAFTPDPTNDRVTIAVSGKVPSAATADTATSATSATAAGSCTGNAATATKLQTARTIAISGKVTGSATSFDGSGNISINATAVTADSCTGNSGTATKLQTPRTINGVAFDGSVNITITDSTAVPPGTIIYMASNTLPIGYLKANGTAVSRTTYAALFAAIGTTFGTGNGSTTFNLPDLRGETIGNS